MREPVKIAGAQRHPRG